MSRAYQSKACRVVVRVSCTTTSQWEARQCIYKCLSHLLYIFSNQLISFRRTPYTQEEDTFLAKYIATYNPGKPGRSGNALYKRLVENEDKKWPWSKHHSWQSWRQRYLDNELRFDARIKLYQKQKGLRPSGGDGKDGEGAGEEQEVDIHSSPPKPT